MNTFALSHEHLPCCLLGSFKLQMSILTMAFFSSKLSHTECPRASELHALNRYSWKGLIL